METELRKKINQLKEKYTFHMQESFQFPVGVCHGNFDEEGYFYYQGGFFPGDDFSSIIKKNFHTGEEEEIDIGVRGIQYIRWHDGEIYFTNSRELMKWNPGSKHPEVIGRSGTGKDEYILPADFFFLHGDLLLADFVSDKIIRYGREGKVADTYALTPYNSPLTMKMAGEEKVVLSLRSRSWSGIKQMLARSFQHLADVHNTRKDSLVVLDLRQRTVTPFREVFGPVLLDPGIETEPMIWDMEVDSADLYLLLNDGGKNQTGDNHLIKYHLGEKKIIFDFNISRRIKAGGFKDINQPGTEQLQMIRPFSIKIQKTGTGKFLVFFINFRKKGVGIPVKTIAVMYKI